MSEAAVPPVRRVESCRLCGHTPLTDLLSLGSQFVSDFVPKERIHSGVECPIELVLCPGCGLVQQRYTAPQDLLYKGTYWYRSGTNATMRACLRDVAQDCEQLAGLTAGDVVLDAGSNDGTLLRSYTTHGLTRVGVEPASNFREEGAKGVDVFINDFWDYFRYSGAVKRRARVVTALGMFYDLDDPQRFVEHIAMALAPGGLFVAQLMCLKQTVRNNDVGNLCHEHLEFYSLECLERLFAQCGLRVVDLYENDVNGGSYRLYVTHESGPRGWQPRPGAEERLARARQLERDMGLTDPASYQAWGRRLEQVRRDLRAVLHQAHSQGLSTFAYGSSTKGNVILQWAGLDRELVQGAADRSPAKWGLYTVGSGIPIMSEEAARLLRPGRFLMLPYAFRQEFLEREDLWRKQGGKWIIPLPNVEVV